MPETPIRFDNVEVLSATDMSMRVLIQDRVVMVGRAQPVDGTTVCRAGDRGVLVLPRWAVRDLGLTEPTA